VTSWLGTGKSVTFFLQRTSVETASILRLFVYSVTRQFLIILIISCIPQTQKRQPPPPPPPPPRQADAKKIRLRSCNSFVQTKLKLAPLQSKSACSRDEEGGGDGGGGVDNKNRNELLLLITTPYRGDIVSSLSND
jgi:hypothetical protein